jgi:hypothetical protein
MIHSFHAPFGKVNLTVVKPVLKAQNCPYWFTTPTNRLLEVQVPVEPMMKSLLR